MDASRTTQEHEDDEGPEAKVPEKVAVHCLFCCKSVPKYDDRQVNVKKKKMLVRRSERLFQYVCNHLEFDEETVTEFQVVSSRNKKKLEGGQFRPGNLPLCEECRERYYDKMYAAFEEYELAMGRLNEMIASFITKEIATSSVEKCGGKGEEPEHEVMSLVRRFREKVHEKNPTGWVDTRLPEVDPENTPSPKLPNKTEESCTIFVVSSPSAGIIRIAPVNQQLPKKTSRRESEYLEKRLQQHSCKFCNQIFPSSTELTRHLVQKHGKEKPEKCPQCDYRCIDKRYLAQHLKTHASDSEREKQFQCSVCEKQFGFQSNLRTHMKTHSEDGEYSCEVCGKQFKSSASRQVCRDRHNGVKNFSCSFSGCDRRFLRKQVLKAHERTHTGEKIHECKECGKYFSQRTPLMTHMKNIHGLTKAKT